MFTKRCFPKEPIPEKLSKAIDKLPSFEPSGGASLPRPVTSKTCMTAAMKRWRYLRRLLHYQQMDFEFAFWQMVYLISNPKVVYKNCKKILSHFKNRLSLKFAFLNLLTTCVQANLNCNHAVEQGVKYFYYLPKYF